MNRKLIRYEVAGAVLVAAVFAVYLGRHKMKRPAASAPTPTELIQTPQNTGAPAAPAPGFLWDKQPGSNPVVQVNLDAFSQSSSWKTSDRVSIRLTPDLPPLEATVAHAGNDDTGSRVSHLTIDGQPGGELMLLENPDQHFFHAQITYPGHAVAYSFHKSGDGIVGERKQLEQLVCANDATTGLPLATPSEAPAVPFLSVAPATALEGGQGGFVVSLSTPTTLVVKVNYQVVAGSADTGDYRSKTGTLSIRAGATTAKISIATARDTVAETDEQFTLLLSAPVNAVLQDESAVATIIDNDSPSSLRVFPVQMYEGSSSTARNMAFTVWLGKAAATNVTVDYATQDGTANAGADYVYTGGTLTIPRGRTSGVINVPIVGDTTVEGDETLTLKLSNAQGAEMAISSATGTLLNDDATPPPPPPPTTTTTQPPPTTQVAPPSNVPKFTSKPGVVGVVFLDFDGYTCSGTTWKNGGTIEAVGIYDVLGDAGVKDVWERFVEAFSPFNLNITTDENYFLNAPLGKRIRVVVTPSNEWYSNTAGGVAYVGSFKWTNNSPVWVFSDNLANDAKFIAPAGIHEVGHALGLEHDGSAADGAYYRGHGTGETSWAPIMGYGLYRNVVQWSRGEYYQANQRQDDTSIIAANPGIGIVADEDDNTAAAARTLDKLMQGVIATPNDVDTFKFSTQGGNVSITATTVDRGPKLDIQLELRNESNTVVATANPPDALDASISTNLPAGNYTLYVSGSATFTPMANPPTGYTNYGTLGQYTIQSSLP